MTTSHRPQLEARSGAKAAGYTPTETEHARLLPGHKKIKYRQQRGENKKVAREKDYLGNNGKVKTVTEDTKEREEDVSSEGEEWSDDDEELLKQELERLKTKRLEEEQTSHVDEVGQSLEEKEEKPPVAKLMRKSWRQGTTFSRNKICKKSTHSETLQDVKNYTNNITKSDYHQEFMKKFIK